MGQEPRRGSRTLGYCRVSGAEQGAHGSSLGEQQERLERVAAERRHAPPEFFVEVESASEGKIEKRTELHRLIAAAQPGDVILVDKVDRWSRDLSWGVASVRALVKRGVGWYSISEGIDASTPQGDSQLGIMAWVADQELRRTRERTVGARQRLRAMGFHVEGLAPPGFVTEGGRGKWKLVPDDAAPIVRRMFKLAIDGHSTREIEAALGHIPSFDHGAIARRLRDRRYLGESNTRGAKGKRAGIGEWRPTHQAIIDRATFDAAQLALGRRRNGGRPFMADSRVANYLLRGFARCATCGYILRAQHPMPNASTRHGWYACTRGCGLHARQDDVDPLVEELVLEHLDAERERLKGPLPPPKKQPDLSAERARLVGRLDRILDAIGDGTVSRERAAAKVAACEAEISALDARRAAAEAPLRAPPREEMLAAVDGLRRAWAGMTVDERRAALRGLAELVEIARTGAKWARAAWEVRITWLES